MSRAGLRLAGAGLSTGRALLRAHLGLSRPATLARWATGILARLQVEVRFTGPISQRGQLWVANHLSWLDPLVFFSIRPARTLAKAEVGGYPVLGRGVRRVGIRLVQREDALSRAVALRGMTRDLMAGEDFLLFPEGTTTDGSGLAPLYEGGLRMAHKLGVTVQTFCIQSEDPHYPWVGDASLGPHLRTLAACPRTRVVVRPGPLLDPKEIPDADAFVRRIRAQITPLHEVALDA